jgi:hypothetical protein
MYPRMRFWWEYVRPHDAGRRAGVGAFTDMHGCDRMCASSGQPSDYGRAAFRVRRPLRLLAYKLGLDAEQVRKMARILDELKTERVQAEVNERHAVAAFADALAGATFEQEKARGGSGFFEPCKLEKNHKRRLPSAAPRRVCPTL